jgi:hypothetical protein
MKIAKWHWIAAAAIATVPTLARPQTQTAESKFRISGTMVNGVTGQPLSKARVMLAPDDRSSQPVEMTTESNGRFAFEGLSAGSWRLQAERRGFFGLAYGQHSVYSSGAISIITGPDGVSENIRFALNPPGAIKGKVTDESGEPIMHAFVQIVVQIPGARKEYLVPKTVATDDTGEYRIPDLQRSATR